VTVVYNHSKGNHAPGVAQAALPLLLEDHVPKSLLDVGCGTGNWLKAAQELGIPEVAGIDGIELPDSQFLAPKSLFHKVDLSQAWDLGRRFDLILCLEVAEHLPPEAAGMFMRSLARHGDLILFSAAPPDQEGDHHLNCQWPAYWQALFNDCGFCCDDSLRWRLWEKTEIPSWYRQNVFTATRRFGAAGKEPRLRRVLHPAMFANDGMPNWASVRSETLRQIGQGSQPFHWYLSLPFRSAAAKLRRRVFGSK
jgi:SAM-dependent methyltransferase